MTNEITPSFVSVKLSSTLVNHGRDAAQTMRRSVASQIEYWATLGRALEELGLTSSESYALIAWHDQVPREERESNEMISRVLGRARATEPSNRPTPPSTNGKGKAAGGKSRKSG